MKEPNIEQQIKDADQQYKDLLITKKEHQEALDRISHRHDEWLKRNE